MDYRVISADDHLDVRFFPADLWTERAPAHLKERVPHIEQVDSLPYWVCDGQRWGRWGQYKSEGPAKWALERGGVMNEGELRPTTAELRLKDMDRDGVDATVMYGPTDPFYTADPEVRYEMYRGYNDWLEEFTKARPDRLIGASQIPLDDPAAAAKEMARVAKLGSRHVNLMAARAVPPIYHEDWEPFWAIAEESGIPVGFHLAVLTFNRPVETQAYSNPAVDRAAGGFRINSQLVEPICALIFGGVLDRHPRLKVVLAESDLSWIPYVWSRTPNDPPREGGPKLPTREYFQRQIWMTFIADEAGVEMVTAGIFAQDRAMWSSDYPHPASCWPDSQATIAKIMHGVPEPLKKKLLFENARDLYGLGA
ncbi:MAG: amidohydrolase family protein [Chloroflexota bacterium]